MKIISNEQAAKLIEKDSKAQCLEECKKGKNRLKMVDSGRPEANGIGAMVTERIRNGHKLTSFFF